MESLSVSDVKLYAVKVMPKIKGSQSMEC